MQMGSTSLQQDKLLAQTIKSPALLFVLWMIGVGFCRSIRDFDVHFGKQFQAGKHVSKLVERGLVVRRGRKLGLAPFTSAIFPNISDEHARAFKSPKINSDPSRMATNTAAHTNASTKQDNLERHT